MTIRSNIDIVFVSSVGSFVVFDVNRTSTKQNFDNFKVFAEWHKVHVGITSVIFGAFVDFPKKLSLPAIKFMNHKFNITTDELLGRDVR